VTAVKLRVPRYIWIVGALALALAGLAAGGDVWGRTDQRSGGTPPNRPADQRQGDQQRPGGRGPSSILPPDRWEWWKDPDFKREIQLTDAQSASIDAIYRARARDYLPFNTEFEKQVVETNRLAGERTVSVEEFAVQVARMEALRTKLAESRYVMLYRMARELTPEQYKKLQEYRDRRTSSRGRGGPR
jgi:Spy/CpxP family protein refolding chaperone